MSGAQTLPDRFTSDPANPSVNATVKCTFENAVLANQEIDVTIVCDGSPWLTVPVQLDGNGHGEFDFECPDVAVLLLQQETSADHAIVVSP